MRAPALLVACALAASASAESRAAVSADAVAAGSVVTVRYYLRNAADGEIPLVEVASARDTEDDEIVARSVEKGYPLEGVGFAVAPDRFLMHDRRIRGKWIDRIEVAFGTNRHAAVESARYPDEAAVELKTASAVGGVVPLAFGGRAALSACRRLSVTMQNGRRFVVAKRPAEPLCPLGGGAAAYGELGDTILATTNGEAVTVSFRTWRTDGDAELHPPSEWAAAPADDCDRRVMALEAALRRRICPVYLRFESKTDGGGGNWWEDDRSRSDDEKDVHGFVLDGGRVLVPSEIDGELMARLRVIEAVAADGTRHKLSFVGACRDWSAFVVEFADGRLPDGFEPFPVRPEGDPVGLGASGYVLSIANLDGRVKIVLQPITYDVFTRTRSGEIVPGSSQQLFLDAEGRLAATVLNRRDGSRWSSDEAIGAGEFARVAASREYDPEIVPRNGTDRVRVAWIGVEVQELTEEVSRQKKALEFVSSSAGSGSLVSRVYPGTPAARAGIAAGDILLDVRQKGSIMRRGLDRTYGGGFDWDNFFGEYGYSLDGTHSRTPWPDVAEGINEVFSRIGIGKEVVVSWVHEGARREAEMTLEQPPVHFRAAQRSRNREIGMIVCDLTFEVRSYFRIPEEEGGVVVLKLKSGDPAAVSGLRPYEIITEVNGARVFSAKEFGEKIRAERQLTFSVRRLTATRIVRIDLGDRPKDEKEGARQ